jgi:hypothetical protein
MCTRPARGLDPAHKCSPHACARVLAPHLSASTAAVRIDGSGPDRAAASSAAMPPASSSCACRSSLTARLRSAPIAAAWGARGAGAAMRQRARSGA